MSDNNVKLINGCVYKITSKINPEMVYYGSTKGFYKRMSGHRADYKAYLKDKFHYLTVFDIFDLGDYKQEIVKVYKGITKKELRKFETEFIQNNQCVNKQQSRTEEYKKNYQRLYDKNCYENNRIKICEEKNKKKMCNICNIEYSINNKARHFKTYRHTAAQELINKEPMKKIIIKMKPKDSSTININITNNS